MSRSVARFAGYLVVAIFLVVHACGQFAQRGGISGSVLDNTGAVVAGATVTLLDQALGQTRNITSDAGGHFQFTGLVAGQYQLSVEKPGFETAKSDPIQVTIGATARYDMKLALGSVNESITVTSVAPLLDTSHASIDVDVSQKQMQQLPLNGLNFTSLAALAPGVSTSVEKNINPGGSFAVGAQFASGGVSFTSGGLVQGSRDNGYYINGVNINDNYESSISYLPASEALQNAKISVTDFSAANGHDVSTFSIQTKGGTTSYHGSIYEHLENDALNATNPYDKAESALLGEGPATKPTLRRNQFGGGLGGPIFIPKVSRLKNRLFFFANYENFIEHDGSQQVVGSVPSAAERTGDFSELLAGATPYQLYNPFTTVYDSSGFSSRQPIPGNRVDLAKRPDGSPVIDPDSAALLALYPLPNATGVPSYLSNFITTQDQAFSNYHFDSRFDATITSKDNAFVTWSRQHGTNNNAGGIFPLYVYDNDDKSWLVTVNEVHIFTPNLTNEFIFGKGYGALTIVSPGEMSYLNSDQNKFNSIFKNTGEGINRGVLGVDVDNYASLGFDQAFLASNNAFQISDNVNWIRGRHAMTFGMNYFKKGEYDWDFVRYASYGGFSRGGYDQNYDGGDAMADLVMGLPRHIHQRDQIAGGDSTAPELNVVFPYWGGYANDKFQINQKLTLSAGIRYDLNIPIYALNKNCCAIYRPDASGGTVALPGIAPGLAQHFLSPQKLDFAPRLSLAYNVSERMVARAGYGIFYDSGASQISTAVGFASAASPGGGSDLTNVILGYPSDTPALHMSDIFQPEPVVPAGQYPVSTGPGQGYFGDGQYYTIYYSDQKSVPLPYYQRYILDIQRQLDPNTSFTLSYSGAQGRKGTNSSNVNLPAYQTGWSTTNAFDAARPNNAGRFGDIYVARPNLNSFYNALIVSIQHRYSHGFELLSNYTFGKTVSDYPWINNLAYNGAPGSGSGGFQYANLRDRGESTLSHRHRFVFSGIWSPIYGRTWPAWSRVVLADWRLSGITTFESGDVETIGNNLTTAADYAGPDELNVSADPNISRGQKSFSRQFNTNVFSAPPNGVRGNSGLGTIRGPGQDNTDLSLAKTFTLHDALVANLRCDSFNAFNHTQWNGIETSYPNSNGVPFGQVTGAREARITQVSLKVSF
jgi:Carboxypeptidase regulatory-like domain